MKKKNFFNEKRVLSFLIVVVPLALVLTSSFFITSFYLEKVNNYFEKAKQRAIKEHVESKQLKSELWVKQLNLQFEYRYSQINEKIEKDLKSRVDRAYDTAKYIYEKYKGKKSRQDIQQRIIDALERITYNDKKNYIFMTDYKGNSIVTGSQKLKSKNIMNFSDSDGRSIILEEIQKVRKYHEGFLRSRFFVDRAWQKIYVKDLGFYNLFIGSSVYEIQEVQQLKDSLLRMIENIPVEKSDFMGLYDDKKAIYLSSKMRKNLGNSSLKIIQKHLNEKTYWSKEELDGFSYYTKYFKPFDWHLVYGFDISKMNREEKTKHKALEEMLDKELDFIVKASASIVLLVMILSLLLSRKVNSIFNNYQNEVQKREDELSKLNASLEQKVNKEVESHRQKDKMLIQQSKMAEMGDMLSMIAHQWRQPLNQMSYVLMNVDSAYEAKELTQEYLDDKIKEANNILEFMSTTIDDFRNYFSPDKDKEFVLVSDVVEASAKFMQKSLEMDGVEIELKKEGRELTHIYKNEFIQVVLNLIKNAKDVLVQNKIQNPIISISSTAVDEKLIVEVKDNGGGVDEKIIDEIFKPYFTTKDKNSGTGLGLYMSKMIIEEHLGGNLSVENKDGGACFKIEI